MLTHGVSVCDTGRVWVSATKMIDPVFSDTRNSHPYVNTHTKPQPHTYENTTTHTKPQPHTHTHAHTHTHTHTL